MSANTNGLAAEVIDGIVNLRDKNAKVNNRGTTALGKDAFLQLLVAQMSHQDPLQPTSDTEWVSQLATYSQLEEMQNLNATFNKQQALSLVGQQVIISQKDSSGNMKFIHGNVDFVKIEGNKTYLSIEGELYPSDSVYSVIDYEYLVKNCLPSAPKVEETYDKNNPKDIKIKLNFGSDMAEATQVAINLNGEWVDSKYLSVSKDGIVTISKDAFKDLEEGIYTPLFVFNDAFNTNSSGNVIIKVTDSSKENSEGETEGTNPPDDTEKPGNTEKPEDTDNNGRTKNPEGGK